MSRFSLLALLTLLPAACQTSSPQNWHNGALRHVVLFQFKEGTPPEKIEAVEQKFRALPSRIPEIIGFEWGTDISTENLARGFTHCFLVTFVDAAGRAAYLPHPAHKEFVELVGPVMENVLVVDYRAAK